MLGHYDIGMTVNPHVITQVWKWVNGTVFNGGVWLAVVSANADRNGCGLSFGLVWKGSQMGDINGNSALIRNGFYREIKPSLQI